ncbi:DegT/DnrJ/EryC1/StrS family aminotransferase [Colwelliaceae bacterium MEBiC 14330]
MLINLNQPIKPDLTKLTKYLAQVNDRGWYTNFGPLHQLFTHRLEEYLGVNNLLLVSNGTLALQVAYKSLDITNALTTPFSFVATASSLLWQGMETYFSEIDRNSYNLCPNKAEIAITSNHDIDAIVATHVFGNPCDVKAFEKLSGDNNIKVVYDAAHAFGVKVENQSILNYGDASTLSFHATKVFHTIEGGAIVFKNKIDFERAKRLINFGINTTNGDITEPGINAKLNEYQCAVGLTLLDSIDHIIEHRSELFKIYRESLFDIVELPSWHHMSTTNGSYMPIKLENIDIKNKLISDLETNSIQSRGYFSPSLEKAFEECHNFGVKNSQEIASTILCLPLHAYMTKEDVRHVVSMVKKSIG